jgi:hypothetical protein
MGDVVYVQVRLKPQDVKLLDDWRRQHRDLPSRSRAIVGLVREGLEHFFESFPHQGGADGKAALGSRR